MISVLCVVLVFFVGEMHQDENVAANISDRLIIIDAGHGGKDGGAVAPDGTQEQYLNLSVALKMDQYLRAQGYRTLLTRSDDNSIHDPDAETIREQKVSDIHNRLQIVENNPGCVFVSVHQNYFTESQYSGTQVFYSPNNPSSEQLAEYIRQSVVSDIQPDNTRQTKKCGDSIYLMYHATQTAVLVECGFLSNHEETEKLKTESYQSELAKAVCDGIIDYMKSTDEVSTEG